MSLTDVVSAPNTAVAFLGGAVSNFSGGLIPTGLPVAFAAAEGLLAPILVRARNIGGFRAHVTLEEIHSDTLVITEHPVEQGAAITDHAFKAPMRVKMRVGWSNSDPMSGGYPSYVQAIYNAFILLQASRIPIQIITGKRIYVNMLIENVVETTSEATENAAILQIEAREIILTKTQQVAVDSSLFNSSSLSNAQINGGISSMGTKSPVLYPNAPFSGGAGAG